MMLVQYKLCIIDCAILWINSSKDISKYITFFSNIIDCIWLNNRDYYKFCFELVIQKTCKFLLFIITEITYSLYQLHWNSLMKFSIIKYSTTYFTWYYKKKKNEYHARIKILQCITVLWYVLSTKLRTLWILLWKKKCILL